MSERKTYNRALSYGLSGGLQQLPLERRPVEKIIIRPNYTVTDAGISAGENFEGVVDELLLGNDAFPVLQARRNELSVLGDLLHEGISTGIYSDPDPTTATAQNVHYTFTGPFDLRRVSDPFLRLSLRPATDEWGAASAFTCFVTVEVYYNDGLEGMGIGVRRIASASATEHRVKAPTDVDMVGLLIVAGTGGLLDQWNVGNDVNASDAYSTHTDYSAYKKTAPQSSPTRYFAAPIRSKRADGKEIIASATSATTLTFFPVFVMPRGA